MSAREMRSRCGLVHLCALCLLPLVVGQAFIEPHLMGNVEYFDNGGERYGIVGDRSTFDEAKDICRTMSGSLLELRSRSVGEFIGRALAESAVAFSSLWIGGKFLSSSPGHDKGGLGEWFWLSGAKVGPDKIPPNTQFPMTSPPFWLDRPNLEKHKDQCLIVDRNMHHRPLVTGLPCVAKRPFICNIPPAEDDTVPTEITPAFPSETKTYHLFKASMTWTEARHFCRTLGYKLAVVTQQEVFTRMQHRMRRTRPIIESAWIAGIFKDGQWMWVDSKQPISKGGPRSVHKPNSTVEEPPWYRPDKIIHDGCILADRHLCDYFVFVEAKCNRRRNVLCEHETEEKGSSVIQVPDTPFFVSQVTQSWDDAQSTCSACLSPDWTLLEFAYDDTVLFKKQVEWTYLAMTMSTYAEIRHLWMNGQRFTANKKNKFTWGRNFTSKSVAVDPKKFSNSSNSLLSNKGDDGFVIFCPGNYDEDPFLLPHRCLNMDRENQKHFFMYGLKCNFKQHFICMNTRQRDHKLTNITVNSNCTDQVLSSIAIDQNNK